MAVLPVIISVFLMFVLNIYSWYTIISILKNLIPNSNHNEVLIEDSLESSANMIHTIHKKHFGWKLEIHAYMTAAKRLDPVSHRTVFRLLFTPILYLMILTIPTFIIRVHGELEGYTYTVALCSLISTGTINFISWVLYDEEAMKDLRSINIWAALAARESHSSVNSNRPRSIDDVDYNPIAHQIEDCVYQQRDSLALPPNSEELE